MNDSPSTPLSEDAALVAALAATAMPFSGSAEAQAESWIRTLRLHGRVGSAMQALGVGEAPLRSEYDLAGNPRPSTPAPEGDVAERVVTRAHELAAAGGADSTGTEHLLGALLEVYGEVMDRVLELHGASRHELLQRLEEIAEHAEAR
jgi:ATP-dependent Clp protease ATP-binding subunit ClpA